MIRPRASATRTAWVAYARRLAWFTVAFNVLEGLVSMGFGWADGSLSLFGFGADSCIEVGSALLILWRLRNDAAGQPGRERTAAKGIGWMLLALALGTAAGALLQLAGHRHPDTTLPGLVVSVLSTSFMVFLWSGKSRAGKALASGAVLADAACSLACIQLSALLFAGSLAYLLVPGLWWTDAGAALTLSGLFGKEGLATLRAAGKPGFEGGCGCH